MSDATAEASQDFGVDAAVGEPERAPESAPTTAVDALDRDTANVAIDPDTAGNTVVLYLCSCLNFDCSVASRRSASRSPS